MKPSIEELVGRLENLHEIFRVQGEILLYGEEAVEPLTQLLLSPPSIFPEPRVAAAECLGAIGNEKAIDALVQVLSHNDAQAVGPVQRLAEETVRNAAARQLGRFTHPRIANVLLNSLQQDHLIGAGIALAQLRDARAIPYLVECLEDDVKKGKAMEAIQQFGCAAIPDLRDALQRPRFVNGTEPPLSQERRARAAELLGELRATSAILSLKNGLRDTIPRVRLACALSLANLDEVDAVDGIPDLVAGLDDPDLIVRSGCEEALAKLGKKASRVLAQAAAGETFCLPDGGKTSLSSRGRATAAKLLGVIADFETLPCLLTLLDEPDVVVRHHAVVALGGFSLADVVTELEKVASGDPNKAVRTTARGIINKKGRVKPVRLHRFVAVRVADCIRAVLGAIGYAFHRH